MKATTVKKIWKWNGKASWIIFLFWLVETIIFLIVEGWHWKATSPAEIFCDKIVSIGITTIVIVTLFEIIWLIGFLVDKIDEEEKK